MRAPRYGSRCLDRVLPSIASALGHGTFANDLQFPTATQAVLLVVDGLGYEQLLDAAPWAPLLSSAADANDALDAAFPTTTPAGIATITLARPPGQHGFVGATFQLPDFDRVLNPLHWDDVPPPVAVQPEPSLFAELPRVRSHGPAAFARTGMTRTLLAGAEACPYDKFDPAAIDISPGMLDYVYLPELDKAGHTDGAHSPAWQACLREVDSIAMAILRRLPTDALLIVTSDHGMVTVPDGRRIDVDDPLLQAGVQLMAGEPRMRHLYTLDPVAVAARWQEVLGDRAVVLLREQAIADGFFGPTADFAAERIGDVVIVAQADWALASRAVDPKPSGLRGLHGALTDGELLVPGIVLSGLA